MRISLTYDSIIGYIQMAVDIFLVWLLINYLIKIIKNSQKTVQIFQGVLLVVFIQLLAKVFGLKTVEWLADNIMSWGFLALIIVFQPEIRSILEKLGKSNALVRISTLSNSERENLVNELVRAAGTLSGNKTGALITLEQSNSLNDYVNTGVRVNSLVSAELLCSIFMTTTPLHDGAVIIQGDKMACASAYFPPTGTALSSKYGARHRAAIGISEVTDAITIVVSEETGRVSVSENGKLIEVNEKQLRSYLSKVILSKESASISSVTDLKSAVSEEELLKQIKADFEQDIDNSEDRDMKIFKTAAFRVGDLMKQDEESSIEETIVNKTLDETALDSRIVVRKVSVPKDTITRENKGNGGNR